jgi:predicted transcriptional regulator YheO
MKSMALKKYWKVYEPMVQAIVELFHPFVEAAVHDLEKGEIVALYHNISQRKVGDPSPLKELKVKTEEFPDYFDPYYKKNWDGRPLKCTSITIRNEKGKPVGLICLNVDTSVIQDAHRVFDMFLGTKTEAENPVEVYGSSCEEQAEAIIHQYLKEGHLSLIHLSREQKKDLVLHLYHKGIFNFKNAAPYVSTTLNISRASVYNYLKQIGDSHANL